MSLSPASCASRANGMQETAAMIVQMSWKVQGRSQIERKRAPPQMSLCAMISALPYETAQTLHADDHSDFRRADGGAVVVRRLLHHENT